MARPRSSPAELVAGAERLREQDRADLGYVTRVFAQTALPYKRPPDHVTEWRRENGYKSLVVQSGPSVRKADGTLQPRGLPFGIIPRLLLTWMTTEAKRTNNPRLDLGDSLADFMRQLGLIPSGGEFGPVRKLRDQAQRLFTARVILQDRWSDGPLSSERETSLQIASSHEIFQTSAQPEQLTLIPSYVLLSPEFFNEAITRPVPVDMGALQLLRGSAMRLDIYTWLTYRLFYLRHRTIVPWDSLRAQFGSTAETRQARYQFTRDFAHNLDRVLVVYDAARVRVVDGGIQLDPSPPHVTQTKGRKKLGR